MGKARWITMAAGALLALGAGAAQAHDRVHVRVGHVHAPVRTWVPGHWEYRGPARV